MFKRVYLSSKCIDCGNNKVLGSTSPLCDNCLSDGECLKRVHYFESLREEGYQLHQCLRMAGYREAV